MRTQYFMNCSINLSPPKCSARLFICLGRRYIRSVHADETAHMSGLLYNGYEGEGVMSVSFGRRCAVEECARRWLVDCPIELHALSTARQAETVAMAGMLWRELAIRVSRFSSCRDAWRKKPHLAKSHGIMGDNVV